MLLPDISILRITSTDWDFDGGSVATTLALERGAVHVWALGDELMESCRTSVVAWLTPEEIGRACTYRREADRTSSIARRGVLRGLIGRYCGCPPQSVGIAILEFGKPQLVGGANLEFSVSRTQGMVLFAFAREAIVGVDIERSVDDTEVSGIAGQVFSAAEGAALLACEPGDRATFCGMTLVRKEALLKAIGIGLSGDAMAYSTAGGVARYRGAVLGGWSLRDLNVGPAWHAALAMGPRNRQLASSSRAACI